MAIFITALIIVAYAVWIFSRRGGISMPKATPAKNKCKWSKTGDSSGAFVEYRCASCGVAAFSRTDAAPKDCKKGLTGGL
jgi:hypothetical protein